MTETQWTYEGRIINELSDIPKNYIGFVYLITNLNTGKSYIGRKQVLSFRRVKKGKRELAAMTDKRGSKYKSVVKEMKGWQNYTGSNDALNDEIKNGAPITKEILRFCSTKKQLTYYENKALYCNEVIEKDNYYNGNISSKFFPKDLEK